MAQYMRMNPDAREALAQGLLDRDQTSQLALLGERAYATGIQGTRADMEQARTQGRDLALTVDLRLFATIGRRPV